MEPIINLLIVLMFALAFGIGCNDETMATLVGSRAIKFKTAIIMAGSLAFVGVLFLSSSVGKTIGGNLLGEQVDYTRYMMLAVIISTTIWLIVASKTGAPISTTHSVVGSVFGIAIVWSFQAAGVFGESLNWSALGNVVLGWFISPVLGFMGAYLFQLGVTQYVKKQSTGLEQLEKTEKNFIYLLILAVSWTQISRGGNDSANAIGILYGLIEVGDISGANTTWYIIGTGIMLSAGIIIVGKNVIKNVGDNLIEMKPSDAFSIQISTSIVIFLATVLGLPVSGSHILIFAVIGAGRVKGEKPDKKSFRKMVISWVVTFPAAAFLSAICYGITLAIV